MDENGALYCKSCLTEAFEDATVEGYEQFIPIVKNHQKDRHVLAAAIRTGAQVIVKYNIKDFPGAALEDFDIEAQTPDMFLVNLFDLAPNVVIDTFKRQQQQLTNISETKLLKNIRKSAPIFADKLTKHLFV